MDLIIFPNQSFPFSNNNIIWLWNYKTSVFNVEKWYFQYPLQLYIHRWSECNIRQRCNLQNRVFHVAAALCTCVWVGVIISRAVYQWTVSLRCELQSDLINWKLQVALFVLCRRAIRACYVRHNGVNFWGRLHVTFSISMGTQWKG